MTSGQASHAERQPVIFGGFRTETLEDGLAAETFLRTQACAPEDCHANLWEGKGDSLLRRWKRSERWLEAQADREVVYHILGYSMGCQLATRFAQGALSRSGKRFRLGSLTLVAPDPTLRRTRQDKIEQGQGITSAFDEARVLWSTTESAGPAFVEALLQVADACEGLCRIVYCKSDAVAEWSDNVEIMARKLHGHTKVRWIETPVNEVVDEHGVRIRLDPTEVSHIDCADPVHAALWYSLTLEA